jgi:hypothetical protein
VSRALKAEVRNPLLALPAAAKLAALPPESRAAILELLLELRADARGRAEQCWRKHKAPMAAYWKAVAVYANHTSRLVRPGK